MHHRHEFVFHSLWHVEPMEVDMHDVIVVCELVSIGVAVNIL